MAMEASLAILAYLEPQVEGEIEGRGGGGGDGGEGAWGGPGGSHVWGICTTV